MAVRADAPVVGHCEAIIHAPIERIWDLQANINAWPEWNPAVREARLYGPLLPGAIFRWRAGRSRIVSRLRVVDPPARIVWSGHRFGLHTVHEWRFEQRGAGVHVTTRESVSGWRAWLGRGIRRKKLDQALRDSIARLKEVAEQR